MIVLLFLGRQLYLHCIYSINAFVETVELSILSKF